MFKIQRNYLNFSRIYNIAIISDKELNENKLIKLGDYFQDKNNNWIEGTTYCKYYSKEFHIN